MSVQQQQDIEYTNINGYLVPNLYCTESESPHYGKYERMRLEFLQKHAPIFHDKLWLDGKLSAHLNEIDRAANEQMELVIHQMAKQQGINENLKRKNPLGWAAAMNNIRNAAEEVILHDFVYNLP